MLVTFVAIFSGTVKVSAQPIQALNEDWRNSDFSLTSSMMAADLNGNFYVVGRNLNYNLVIKKFSPAGALLWQATYDDPLANLQGVWIVGDGNGNAVVLAANTAYRYRLRAYNSAGDSPYSNTSSAKTLRK